MTEILRNPHLPFIELKKNHAPAYPVRRHSHEELSFGFVEAGSSTIFCKALELEMAVNQVMLLPPGAVHLCQPSEEGRFSSLMLHVDPGWVARAFGFDPETLSVQATGLGKKELHAKERYFSSFVDFDNPLEAESDTLDFIGWMLFGLFNITLPESPPDKGSHTMSQIKTFMDENYTEPIQLDDLAALAGKSKFSLLRQFSSAFKLTPHAYLTNQRINHAKKRLLEGESAAQTAVACGFFDQSHFIKSFKQYVGLSPSDYLSKPDSR